MKDGRTDALTVEAATETATFEARPVAVHCASSRERYSPFGTALCQLQGLAQGMANGDACQILQCSHLKDGYNTKDDMLFLLFLLLEIIIYFYLIIFAVGFRIIGTIYKNGTK